MTSVVFGPAPFDLRPFVAAQILELGYFRAECIEELARLLEQLWPSGVSAMMLIRNELEDMTNEQKIALGLNRGRMPRAVWSMLSEAGRVDARRAVTETTTGIVRAVQRERFDRDKRKHPEIWGSVTT